MMSGTSLVPGLSLKKTGITLNYKKSRHKYQSYPSMGFGISVPDTKKEPLGSFD